MSVLVKKKKKSGTKPLTTCFFSPPQVKVMDWMRGQTCGLCGQADGEFRQEYRTPNKRIAKNAVSFAHSWVVPATTCQNADSNIYLRFIYFYFILRV